MKLPEPTRHPRFAAVLGQAAAAGLTADRRLDYLDVADAAGFFAENVRSAILPRALHFSRDGVPCLRALAKGGALLEIGGADEEGRLVGAEDIEAVSNIVKAAFSAGQRASVRSAPAKVAAGLTQAGIHADTLSIAFGRAEAPAAAKDWIELLTEAAREVTLAIFRGDRTEDLLEMHEQSVPKARALATQVFGALGAASAGVDREHLLILYPQDFSDMAACFPVGALEGVCLFVHRDAAEEVAEFWASLAR
ncbi:MAG: hypothetical protein AAGH70_08030 [Pseudomonadota bacterium]